MMKPITILLLLMTLTSCDPAPQPPVAPVEPAAAPTAVEVAEQGDSLKKKAGDSFTIELESNPTTGFSWALDEKMDANVVRKVSNDYVAAPHAPGLVGSGGTERWVFQAEKTGTTVLHFMYRRPWEKGIEPARERTISVQVD